MTPVSRHTNACIVKSITHGGDKLHAWIAIMGLLHTEARHGLSHLDTQLTLTLTW